MRLTVSTTPAPVVALHYAASQKPVVVVVPHSAHAVYFGPHSRHPEDEEALIDYRYYLKGVAAFPRVWYNYLDSRTHITR